MEYGSRSAVKHKFGPGFDLCLLQVKDLKKLGQGRSPPKTLLISASLSTQYCPRKCDALYSADVKWLSHFLPIAEYFW